MFAVYDVGRTAKRVYGGVEVYQMAGYWNAEIETMDIVALKNFREKG